MRWVARDARRYKKMRDNYEIRRMGERGIRHGYFCSGTTGRIACLEKAIFYLVRARSWPTDKAESRQRRCVACAEIDAKALGIPMPRRDTDPTRQYLEKAEARWKALQVLATGRVSQPEAK